MDLPLFFSTRAHVLVCTGSRCARRGARQVFAAAWASAEARHVAYYAEGGTVRLTESGCQGACEHGPNAVAYHARDRDGLAQAWYCGLDTPRLVALLDALHEGGPLPTEGRYDR